MQTLSLEQQHQGKDGLTSMAQPGSFSRLPALLDQLRHSDHAVSLCSLNLSAAISVACWL